MIKRLLLIMLVLCFNFMALKAQATPKGPNFNELLQDIHHQISKWQIELKRMEERPNIPAVQKALIGTLIKLMDQLNKVIEKFLPKQPQVKKVHTLRQQFQKMSDTVRLV